MWIINKPSISSICSCNRGQRRRLSASLCSNELLHRPCSQPDRLEAIYLRSDPKIVPIRSNLDRVSSIWSNRDRFSCLHPPLFFWRHMFFSVGGKSIDIWQPSCHYVMAAALAVSSSFYNSLLQCLNFVLALRKIMKKEKACFAAKKLPLIPRINEPFSYWSSTSTMLSILVLAKTKNPPLLHFLAEILNTGSFSDPVYPFTLTIEWFISVRSEVDQPFCRFGLNRSRAI